MTVPALYQQHIGLAVKIGREFYLPGADDDDVQQEARIGLWIAARNYDESQNVPFAAWATIVIRRRLVTLVRAANSQRSLILTEAERDDDLLLSEGTDVERVCIARDILRRLIANRDNLIVAQQRRDRWSKTKRAQRQLSLLA